MKTEKLMKQLTSRIESHEDLPWLIGYTDFGSFRPDGSPEGDVTLKETGDWLSVVIEFDWDGTTMDQTTDRLSGDPYTAVVTYDWIGPKKTAPKEVSKKEELDEWASISLKYVRENNDSGWWGSHKGSWVESIKEDGTVVIRDVDGRYQDENPMSLGEQRTVKL